MLKYVYDMDDTIASIGKDKLKGISFKYNKDKWLTEIDGILSGNTSTKIRVYEYYSDGKIKNIKDFSDYLNGGSKYIQRDYEYDALDRVVFMKYFNSKNADKILEQYEYTYDKNSNILSTHTKLLYDNNFKDEERKYQYDSLNHLVKTNIVNNLTYEKSEITYSFDKVGNKIKMTKDGVTITYTYNDLDQLVKSVENNGSQSYTTTYSYDEKGNQIKVVDGKNGTVTENTYDVESQIVKVKTTTNGKVTATQENEYNNAGQRIAKTDNGVKTCYYYEGSLLLYTTDASGNKTSQNIIGNHDNIISSIRYDNGQHAYFYSKDVQGSASVITDEHGNCVTAYDYKDYGETTKKVNADFYNEICYTGGVYDELTGEYYLNARYYNPEDGVFLSQDTYRGDEGNYQSWNLYAYCAGNPINYVDPSGHWVETVFDVASIGYSSYEFVSNPSWANLGYLAWDVGAAIVPFAPGSYTAKGVKAATKVSKATKATKSVKAAKAAKITIQVADKVSDFKKGKKALTIGKYSVLRKGLKGRKGIEVHHIVEKRLLPAFKSGIKSGDMLSIPLEKNLHRKITKRWRKAIKYGTDYKNLTKKELIKASNEVYRDMPKLKKLSKKWIKKNFRK